MFKTISLLFISLVITTTNGLPARITCQVYFEAKSFPASTEPSVTTPVSTDYRIDALTTVIEITTQGADAAGNDCRTKAKEKAQELIGDSDKFLNTTMSPDYPDILRGRYLCSVLGLEFNGTINAEVYFDYQDSIGPKTFREQIGVTPVQLTSCHDPTAFPAPTTPTPAPTTTKPTTTHV